MLRKITTLFLFVISHVVSSGQSIRKSEGYILPGPILKVNILSPVYGSLSFAYEKPIDRHSSNQFGLFFFTGQIAGNTIPAGGFGLTYDYRFYMKNENQTGLYIQPFFRYQYFYVKESISTTGTINSATVTDETSINVWGTGLLFGKQWMFFKKFTLDIYFGPMFNYNEVNSNNATLVPKDLTPLFWGYWYRSGLTFGYQFEK